MPRYIRSFVPGGTYFFTVALEDRRSRLLVEHVDQLRLAYRRACELHPFDTLAICVLPDHVHAIWRMPPDDADFALRWRLIKSGFSRGFESCASSASQHAKREKGIWQRRYWEHQIRDEDDLARHVEYVHFNPVRHGHVRQVAHWPHSSFHRWVSRGELPAEWGLASAPGGQFGE
jgi:putative transposase